MLFPFMPTMSDTNAPETRFKRSCLLFVAWASVVGRGGEVIKMYRYVVALHRDPRQHEQNIRTDSNEFFRLTHKPKMRENKEEVKRMLMNWLKLWWEKKGIWRAGGECLSLSITTKSLVPFLKKFRIETLRMAPPSQKKKWMKDSKTKLQNSLKVY